MTLDGLAASMTTWKVKAVSWFSSLLSADGTWTGWELIVARGQKVFQFGYSERERRIENTNGPGLEMVVRA